MFSHYDSQAIILGSNSIVATNIICSNHVNYITAENLAEKKGRKGGKEGRERRKKIFNHACYLETPHKI